MSPTKKNDRKKDLLFSGIVTVFLIIIVGILFDYYYEFNDDVLMKNMLSGAYTGTPEGHNIQMLWPISALLALVYRIFPSAPVYGIFLCACQYGCIELLIYRAIRISSGKRKKYIISAIIFILSIAIFLQHLVMIQYTITVAVLAATAAFLFYTIPDGLNFKQFILQAMPAASLVVLAFLVRSEMLLLMLPYIAITGFVRWNRENSLHPNIMSRYFAVVGIIILGMGISFVADKAAYSSDEWKAFKAEFNARTELYDYQYVPNYSENVDFYKSIGLSESDVNLLINYDYGIDSKIDADIIDRVAKKASELRDETIGIRVRKALKEYFYRLTHLMDGAYQVTVFFLYIMLVWAIYLRKESTFKHKLIISFLRIGGLFVMRSISWFYIILGHRKPDRIVHSLYLIEIVILFAMLMTEINSKIREKGYIQLIASVVLIGGGVVLLPITIMNVYDHVAGQEKINHYGTAIDNYCSDNPDSFYFVDVYSTIINGETFNELMFRDVDNSLQNYDLIGGWAVNSPLYRKKIEKYDITDVASNILSRDDIFIICSIENGTEWITDYYADEGKTVSVNLTDVISSTLGVYRISEKQ